MRSYPHSSYYQRYEGYGFWAAVEERGYRGIPGMVPFPAAQGCRSRRGRARLPAAQVRPSSTCLLVFTIKSRGDCNPARRWTTLLPPARHIDRHSVPGDHRK